MARLLPLVMFISILGCGRPAASQQEQHAKDLLLLWFNTLNNEAELAKMDAKIERKFADEEDSIGRQYNSYFWHPNGMILEDLECPLCKTKHLIVTYTGQRILCSACGSRRSTKPQDSEQPLIAAGKDLTTLQAEFPDRVKPMFSVHSDVGSNKVILVRYVRRHWLLDDQAKIEVNPKVKEKYPVDELVKSDERNQGKHYYSRGFHRLDSTYVATTAFLYDGTLQQIDPSSVAKLISAKEAGDPKTWKLGPTVALEEPVRPWDAPRKLNMPNMRPN